MREVTSPSLHVTHSEEETGPVERFTNVFSQDPLCALKIVEDPEELLFICYIYWYLLISEIKTSF